MMAALATIPARADERRVALVIANAGYRFTSSLTTPLNDADAIIDKLRGLGFEVTPVVDRDRADMERAIDDFARANPGADVMLIYYAGHGIQVDDTNYLLPVDAQLGSRDDLQGAAISEGRLLDVFAHARPGISLLILDACRSNPFHDLLHAEMGPAVGGYATPEEFPNRIITELLTAYSASPGQVALDGETGNSPFVTALLAWIDRPGVDVERVFTHVTHTVNELTGGSQRPWKGGSISRVVLLRPPDAESSESFRQQMDVMIARYENPLEREAMRVYLEWLSPGRDHQPPAATPDDQRVVVLEALRWVSIQTSANPAMFRAFLAAFPEGRLAGLAQERLATLEGSGAGWVAASSAAPEPAPESAPDPEPAPEPAPEPVPDIDALAAAEAMLRLDRDLRIAVQQLLAQHGVYAGSLDGAIGPMSREAIAAFQGSAGLEVTSFLVDGALERLVDGAARQALAAEEDAARRAAIHRLAAVAQLGPGAVPTTIRVASIGRHPQVLKVWREAADGFEDENPGYTVVFDTRPGPEYKTQLLGMLGSDAPPDILFTWGGGHLRALAQAGFATDLTQSMTADWAPTFKPAALANLFIEDRIYAAPSNMSLVNLWANRRLLDEAGVDPASLATWDGLLGAVRHLKAAGTTPIAVGGADRWPLQHYWAGLVLAIAGRNGLEAALAGEGEGFQAAAFEEAGMRLQELAEMEPFQEDFRDLTQAEAVRAFIGGWTAMTLAGDWHYSDMIRNWPGGPAGAAEDLLRLPFPPTGLGADAATTMGGSDGWVLRNGAPAPTLDLLRRLAGLETQGELARLGSLVPSIAAVDDMIADPAVAAMATELTMSRHHQLFLDQVFGPYAGERLNDAVVALVDGDLTPAAAAAEIEGAWAEVRPALTIGPPPGVEAPLTVE